MGCDPAQIVLRPIRDSDLGFLRALYASTRAAEMALTGWPQEAVDAFLAQQFAAQHDWYMREYAGARFDIVECGGVPIGRLYVSYQPRDIRIVDIALLPEYRNRGIGGGLLRQLLDEGVASGRSVSIHVEMFNPAQRLYRRLGFEQAGVNGPYLLLVWRPAQSAS